MLARWTLHLFESDLEISHRAAIKNRAALEQRRLEPKNKDPTDINDDLSVTIANFNEDNTRATKVTSDTICQVCDHKQGETGPIMPEVQAPVQQNDSKYDSPPNMAEFIADQARDRNVKQYTAILDHHD